MKNIQIHQLDAFSAKLFGGNPGAVVFDADDLTESDMRNIAREMNISETGYVLKSQTADFRLRYFTPSDEITFCGHVTLATLGMIAREKRFGADQGIIKQYDIEVNAGLVKGEIDWTHDQPIISFFPLPINLDPVSFNHVQVAEALGIPLDAIDQSKPILIERTNRYVYFAIKSLQQLKELQVNQETAKAHAKQHNDIVLYCALTAHGIDEGSHAHSRVYAPLVGIAEDPVTGSSQGPLTAYMVKNEMIDQSLTKVNTEQGDFVDRAGRASVSILNRDPIHVKVSGPVFHVFSADMQLP